MTTEYGKNKSTHQKKGADGEMANGTIHKLGTLYCGGTKQPYPTKPWDISNPTLSSDGSGNIYNNNNSTSTAISIGNTDSNDSYKLRWVEVNDGDETYLICDRVLVVNITWDRLNTLGFCNKKGSNGKKITIDGQQYELFMMTGGASSSDTSNDWDRWIGNLGSFSGLPTPTSTDTDNSLDAADRSGTHDKLWHWTDAWSWCQNAPSDDSSYRVDRGGRGARGWRYYNSGYYYAYVGWRPALRILNTAPSIAPSSKDYGETAAAPDIQITVTDSDGDAFTGTVTVDGVQKQTFSGTSSGTFTLNTSEWWSTLSNAKHTITVTATDSNSASSTVTYTVTKTNSAAAAPTITNLKEGMRRGSEFYVEFTTGTDAEGDTQTLKVQLADDSAFASPTEFTGLEKKNGDSWESVSSVSNDDAGSTFRIKVSGLTIDAVRSAKLTKYVRVATTDSGSGVPAYSDTVQIILGDTLSFMTKPYDTDAIAEKATVFMESVIDSNATVTVQITNNANDDSPAWEDCSTGEAHTFSNTAATGTPAVATKVTVTAGDATETIKITAVGIGVI